MRFEQFVDRAEPNYAILMDASDFGVCAAFSARKEYLQIKFDANERREIVEFKQTRECFDINVR